MTILVVVTCSSFVIAGAEAPTFSEQADQASPTSPKSYVPFIDVHEYSYSITLEEARAKAPFEIPTPTYLPENLLLVDIREMIYHPNVFFLTYSDPEVEDPDSIHPFIDMFGSRAPKFVICIASYFGEIPDNERVEHMAPPMRIYEYIETETGALQLVEIHTYDKHCRTVEIEGVEIKGFGRDLGYKNSRDGRPLYSFVEWWKNGLHFSIKSGTYPLDELVKVAGSMMITSHG